MKENLRELENVLMCICHLMQLLLSLTKIPNLIKLTEENDIVEVFLVARFSSF